MRTFDNKAPSRIYAKDLIVSDFEINRRIKIQGRSGCRIIFDQTDSNVIIKISRSPGYNHRLKKQHDKQNCFFERHRAIGFDTPEVYFSGIADEATIKSPFNGVKEGKVDRTGHQFSPEHSFSSQLADNNFFWFQMRYIPGESYSQYLMKATKQEIDRIIDIYLLYFNKFISESEIGFVTKETITTKIDSIKIALRKTRFCKDELISKALSFLENYIPVSALPLGFCHGDFTLSNVIFSDGRIFLIDFLDSFIESPIMDVVKLRQDTKFNWTMQLEVDMPVFKQSKTLQILKYFDQRIMEWLQGSVYHLDWYPYLEVMNLVRILPYLERENEVNFIYRCLRKEL